MSKKKRKKESQASIDARAKKYREDREARRSADPDWVPYDPSKGAKPDPTPEQIAERAAEIRANKRVPERPCQDDVYTPHIYHDPFDIDRGIRNGTYD